MKRKRTYCAHAPERILEWIRVSSLPKNHPEYMLPQKPQKPAHTSDTIVATLEEEIKIAKQKQEKRKFYQCSLCEFTHKNKYQKVKSSGLPVWRHHDQLVCKHRSQAQDDEITKEVKQRMAAAKAEKLRKKNLKKPCPFGCGKSWKNIYSASVKKHVLHGCSFREAQEHLLLDFFVKKKPS